MSSIYVAGASSERDMIARYMSGLRRAGHVIAVDWVAAMAACPVPEADMPEAEALRYAHADLRGIRECDVFWLLAPSTTSTGAWLELGYALGQRKAAVVISGPCPSIFARCASTRFAVHELAFGALCRKEIPHG